MCKFPQRIREDTTVSSSNTVSSTVEVNRSAKLLKNLTSLKSYYSSNRYCNQKRTKPAIAPLPHHTHKSATVFYTGLLFGKSKGKENWTASSNAGPPRVRPVGTLTTSVSYFSFDNTKVARPDNCTAPILVSKKADRPAACPLARSASSAFRRLAERAAACTKPTEGGWSQGGSSSRPGPGGLRWGRSPGSLRTASLPRPRARGKGGTSAEQSGHWTANPARGRDPSRRPATPYLNAQSGSRASRPGAPSPLRLLKSFWNRVGAMLAAAGPGSLSWELAGGPPLLPPPRHPHGRLSHMTEISHFKRPRRAGRSASLRTRRLAGSEPRHVAASWAGGGVGAGRRGRLSLAGPRVCHAASHGAGRARAGGERREREPAGPRPAPGPPWLPRLWEETLVRDLGCSVSIDTRF